LRDKRREKGKATVAAAEESNGALFIGEMNGSTTNGTQRNSHQNLPVVTCSWVLAWNPLILFSNHQVLVPEGVGDRN
jgi:hypothetical protein